MKVKNSLKNFFKSFLCYLSAVIILVSAGLSKPVFAKVNLPNGRDDEFSENNIVFYNPDGKKGKKKCRSVVGANCNIIGDTKDEKLWSGIRGYGFTPEQTAALLGNFAHEGGTPTTQESAYVIARNKNCKTKEGKAYTIHTTTNEHHAACMQAIYSHYSDGKPVVGIGLGFVQWSSAGRREGYLAKLDALDLKDTYFEGDAYKEWGSLTDAQLKAKIESTTGSDEDYWSLWCAAIAYINEELHSGSYSAFFSLDSVEEMAGYIAASYEVCSGCKKGSASYNARVESAKAYYQQYLNGGFDSVESGGDISSEEEGSEGEEKKKDEVICGDDDDSGEPTKREIGDYTYAFPLKGATKSNYLNPGGSAGDSVLSRVPCGSGTCHHDYNAVDLGLRASMAGYTELKASDRPGDGLSDMYYYSTGVKVVALVGGKISYFSKYTNKVPSAYHNRCGQALLEGEDGKKYWLGHMAYPGAVKGGDTVTAGQVIGEVGLPQCAQTTQAHLHINVSPQSANDHYIIDVIDALWEDLPN